jgi:hypothetical protein
MGWRNTIFCLNAHQKQSGVRSLSMFNLRIYFILTFFFLSSAPSFSQDEDISTVVNEEEDNTDPVIDEATGTEMVTPLDQL